MSKMQNIETQVQSVLSRFERFGHAPTSHELWSLFPVAIRIEELESIIDSNLAAWGLTKYQNRYQKKTVSDNSHVKFDSLQANAKTKLQKARGFAELIDFIEGISLVGVSGSVASGYAKIDDDIDIFVITKANMIWRVRFFLNLISYILGVKRKREVMATNSDHQDKFCFNLFLSEEGLALPKSKDTAYVASEIYFLKLLTIRGRVYDRFLEDNVSIIKKLPNADFEKSEIHYPPIVYELNIWQKLILSLTKLFHNMLRNHSIFESILGIAQRVYMNPHRTKEVVTPTQLWFHPRDLNEELDQ